MEQGSAVLVLVVQEMLLIFQGEILPKATAQGHVCQLKAAADAKNREFFFDCDFHGPDLALVCFVVNGSQHRQRIFSIKTGVYVLAAGEKKTLAEGEKLH